PTRQGSRPPPGESLPRGPSHPPFARLPGTVRVDRRTPSSQDCRGARPPRGDGSGEPGSECDRGNGSRGFLLILAVRLPLAIRLAERLPRGVGEFPLAAPRVERVINHPTRHPPQAPPRHAPHRVVEPGPREDC